MSDYIKRAVHLASAGQACAISVRLTHTGFKQARATLDQVADMVRQWQQLHDDMAADLESGQLSTVPVADPLPPGGAWSAPQQPDFDRESLIGINRAEWVPVDQQQQQHHPEFRGDDSHDPDTPLLDAADSEGGACD